MAHKATGRSAWGRLVLPFGWCCRFVPLVGAAVSRWDEGVAICPLFVAHLCSDIMRPAATAGDILDLLLMS